MATMGFYEHNSFGKFNGEVKSSLPTFGADTLTGRPGSSGELDFNADSAADITNYSPDIFSKFVFDDAVDVAGDGIITSRGDRGFHFTVDSDADIESQPVTISKDSNTYTWNLAPGDQLRWSHVGSGTNSNKEVTLEKADGTIEKKLLSWIPANSSGSQYQIALGLPVAAQTGNGNGGSGNDGTGNGGDDTQEGSKWPLIGVGVAALVGVGIIMAKRK